MIPKERYKIVVRQNPQTLATETIAISSYAGKTVKGIAKCHPDDEYDEEKGIDLAIARCALKIAKKRVARASSLYEQSRKEYYDALVFLDEMNVYYVDAAEELAQAQEALTKLTMGE